MSKKLTRGRVVLGLAAVGVVAAVALALRPDPTTVETASVVRAPLRVTVDADGRTRVRDRYVVTAPVGGRLERVALREGESVRGGAVVARIAPAPLDEPTVRQARARLDAARGARAEADANARLAESSLQQARRDAERARRLVAAGALAPRGLEEAELDAHARAAALATARAHVTAARADVAQAQAALLSVDPERGIVAVRAPAPGRVLRLPERSERVVAPGAVLAEIGDTHGMEVVADVLSSEAARVRPGAVVELDGWGGGAPLRGQVRLIEPAAATRVSALGVEEQRVNVLIDLPDAPAALGDGYRVDVRIVVWAATDVLTVPASALVRSGADWAVFVVEDGRAQLRRVRVGELGGASAQVVAGLRAGDTVVVFPSDKVRAGVRVRGA